MGCQPINATIKQNTISVTIKNSTGLDIVTPANTVNIDATVKQATSIDATVRQATNINVVTERAIGVQLPTERIEIEGLYKIAYDTKFRQFNYTAGNITGIDVYDVDPVDPNAVKLFTKTIAYTDGNITLTTLLDELSGKTLTKTITYDIDGNIDKISEVLS